MTARPLSRSTSSGLAMLLLSCLLVACGGAAAPSTAPSQPVASSPAASAGKPAASPSNAGPAASQPAASVPIKVGLVLPLTGPTSTAGKENVDGFNLYLDSVNGTMAGRKVEVVTADTA